MRGFEYVTILFSVLLGLSISRLLAGAARTIVDPARALDWLPALWTFHLFVTQVTLWWLVFQRVDQATWSFAHYLVTLAYPVLFFFLAVLLFPGLEAVAEGTMESFMDRRKWFYGLLLAMVPLDALESALAGGWGDPLRGSTAFVTTVVVFGVAMWTRSRVYHGVLAGLAAALAVAVAIAQLPVIG